MASVPFNNLITFSRGTNATLTGPNGLIQYAPNNLFTFSEQFDNAAWTKSNATVTANATTAPDGTTTADTLIENTATGTHVTFQVFTFVAATAYTYSAYVKANGRTKFDFASLSGFSPGASFDLTAVTATPLGATSAATITAVGNDWYRCTATRTSAGGSDQAQIRLVNAAGASTYTGDGTSGIFVWGAQLELGSTATTYNSTTVKNLLGFSEAFDNAAWTKSNASIVTGAQANPVNGAFNAQKLMENTAAGVFHSFNNASGIPGVIGPRVFSIYAKAAERRYVSLDMGDYANGIVFDLQTGTVTGTSTAFTSSITPVGNGWYRCSVGKNFTVSTTVFAEAIISTSPTLPNAYTGDGNSGVYIYGAQLSDSASLDPYVPTPGAAPSSTAYYGPRFDYDPVTLQPKGILVEEARTNLLTGSADFTATYWPVATNAVVTANDTTSPDGTTNADKLADNTTAGVQHRLYRDYTFTAASHTLSVFAKRNDHRWLRLFFFDGTTSFFGNFDLLNGAVGNKQASTTTTITSFGNGWYRCTMTATTAAAAGNIQMVMLPSDDSAVPVLYTGTGTSLWLFGAQLEAGAFATSYIPTIASTVTRSADVATITGSLFSQWYTQPQGTFVADFDVIWSGNAPASMGVIGLDASASKRFAYISSGSQNASTFDGSVAFGTANNIGSAANKVASAYDTSRYIALNGGAVATGTFAAGYSSGTSLDIGKYGASNPINGHIRSVQFYPVRAADFQLQQVTT